MDPSFGGELSPILLLGKRGSRARKDGGVWGLSREAAAPKKALEVRVAPHEIAEEHLWFLRAAFAEDFVSERLAGFGVEHPFFLEARKSVGVEYFCPLVAVVTCPVAGGRAEEVGEVAGNSGSFGLEWSLIILKHGLGKFV